MRKIQIIIYILVAVLAYCEQEQIPVGALVWNSLADFWYGLAEFAGRMGIRAEQNYYKEVQHG